MNPRFCFLVSIVLKRLGAQKMVSYLPLSVIWVSKLLSLSILWKRGKKLTGLLGLNVYIQVKYLHTGLLWVIVVIHNLRHINVYIHINTPSFILHQSSHSSVTFGMILNNATEFPFWGPTLGIDWGGHKTKGRSVKRSLWQSRIERVQ